jgi:hypothetical protein
VAKWFISSWDEMIGKKISRSDMKEPEICIEIKVTKIQIQENLKFSNKVLIELPAFRW